MDYTLRLGCARTVLGEIIRIRTGDPLARAGRPMIVAREAQAA